MEIDFRTLYHARSIPLKITVTITERKTDYAMVRLVRELLAMKRGPEQGDTERTERTEHTEHTEHTEKS